MFSNASLTPNAETPLKALPLQVHCLLGRHTCLRDLAAYFQDMPSVSGALIFDGGEVQAVISRIRFQTWSRDFGRTKLQVTTPLFELPEYWGAARQYLCLSGEARISAGVAAALGRPGTEVYEPVVIEENHQFGLLDVGQLMVMHARICRPEVVDFHSDLGTDEMLIVTESAYEHPGPRFLYVNEAFLRATGFSRDEVIGQTPRLLQGPRTDQHSLDRLRNAMAERQAVTVELLNYRKDGSEFFVELSVVPVQLAGEQPSHFLAIQRDISERKQAEAERQRLLEEARQMRAIAEQARREAEAAHERVAFLAEASAVLSVSLDRQLTLANLGRLSIPRLADGCMVYLLDGKAPLQQVVALHCDPAKQCLLNELADLYQPNPEDLDSPVGRVLQIGATQVGRVDDLSKRTYTPRIREILAGLAPQSFLAVPLKARGRTLGALVLIRTETENPFSRTDMLLAEELARRAAQALDNAHLYQSEQNARTQAQVVNRVKEEFLTTLSHELRTPLNAIIGFAQLLQRGTLDDKSRREGVAAIERNGRLQLQQIDDLLDVSNLLTGRLKLRLEPVEMRSVVEEALESVHPAALVRQVSIDFAVPGEPCLVAGDVKRLQQVVRNLLSNAVRFSAEGEQVLLSLVASTETVELTIQDTGAGIAPEFMPFLFERFRQADGTSTRVYGGLGLGLAIVRDLIDLHGGVVEARSPGVGQGATFIVRLPRLPMQSD